MNFSYGYLSSLITNVCSLTAGPDADLRPEVPLLVPLARKVGRPDGRVQGLSVRLRTELAGAQHPGKPHRDRLRRGLVLI